MYQNYNFQIKNLIYLASLMVQKLWHVVMNILEGQKIYYFHLNLKIWAMVGKLKEEEDQDMTGL